MRAAKVQASLRIRAVSPEPPLLAHTSSESRGTFRQKTDSWPLWMAGHAQLKFVMTECSKTQIRLTRPIKKKLCKEWRPLHIPDQIPLHRFIHFWTDFTTALYRDWNVGDLTYDCLQPLSAIAWLEHVKDTRSSDLLIRSQTRSRLPRKEGKYGY